MSTNFRELPMPNVTRITNLNQAHATLLHCCNKLARFAQQCQASGSSGAADGQVTEERRQFQQWLERWEQAFTEFLASAMVSMGSEDLTQCRVLKANHLACNVVASGAGPGTSGSDASGPEFQAITDLAGAVLQTRRGTGSPQSAVSSPSVSPVISGLDVQDPLYIVLAHCSTQALRTLANELLLRFY
ncbi:hypothetical protein LTR36_005987 [Oleoguttula mirabilis]|uniref:Uncharacterized protein n=1 Tax=Oleoguttula mirabilis TaxID=1507867 RepID=A0AAV9JDB6_9PEZI|nr:hypothetical protein LTR36_005987 [Oleoguttula mirabilis]